MARGWNHGVLLLTCLAIDTGCWLEASVSSYVGFHWAAHKTHTHRFFFFPPVIFKAADALHNGCENLTGSELEKGYLSVCLSTHIYL